MSGETAGVDKNIAAKVALLGLPIVLPLHVPLQVPGGVETKKVLLFAIPRNFTSKVHFCDYMLAIIFGKNKIVGKNIPGTR
jgi:hypothetical protein